MSKRNFILLIIVLAIVVLTLFGFFYFRKVSPNTTGNNTPGTNFISQFNPFGNGNTTKTPTTTPPTNVSGYVPPANAVTLKLIKVSSMPIAGFTVFSEQRLKEVVAPAPSTDSTSSPQANSGSSATPTTTTLAPSTTPSTKKVTKSTPPATEFAPFLRYVDKATGNIFETFADKIAEQKFSSTTIPQIYDAFFGNNGQSVIMRYLKTDGETIETFIGNLPKEPLGGNATGTNEVKGNFLSENIEGISLSPDTSSVFYLFNSGNNMIGTTLNFVTNKKVQIFSSPFTEWLPQWGSAKNITLTAKPSSGVPGYMYEMSSANGSGLIETLGPVNGMTTLTSPNGKMVLYNDDNLALYLYHKDTKISDLLGVKTMPEKCVWGNASDVIYCSVPKYIPTGQYPDAWYQGTVSFADQIWKIDVKTENATIISDPLGISGQDIDGIELALDSNQNYLFFVNKKDSYLWELGLK